MSLIQRVERAQQQLLETPETKAAAAAAVPIVPSPPVAVPISSERRAAREELLHEIRLRLQTEVMVAFDTLLDLANPDELRAKVTAIVERVVTSEGFVVTRDEKAHLIEELIGEVGGLGPLDPLLLDETITEIMVNGPSHVYVERAGKIQRVDSYFLNDEHVLRVIDRIITPLGRRIDAYEPQGRRTPGGWFARECGHRTALAGRAGDHRPKVPGQAGHGGRPHPLRHSNARDVRLPERLRQGPAECLRVRRHGIGQDDDPQRPVLVHPRGRADRDDRGRRRAPAPSGPRRDARVPPAEYRGHRRDHDPGPAAQRPAHAPRSHHRRGVSFR